METGCEEVNCTDVCLSFIRLWALVLAVLNVGLQLQGNCWYTLKLKVECKEVKTQVVICNNVVNWTTCFGLLGGHHQVQQAIGDSIFHGFKLLDVEISSSIFFMAIVIQKIDDEISTSDGLNPWNILSPITFWTWWWPPSRPKYVVQLTTLLQITTCVMTSLHCTFMLHTQRGCLNSR